MRRHPLVLCFPVLLLVSILAAGVPATLAQTAGLSVDVVAYPATVQAGKRVTYAVTIENATGAALNGATLRYTLPAGFDPVPGSTRVRANGWSLPALDATMSGTVLTWENLSLPTGRSGGVFGMHTFVQDRCETDYVVAQLDRAAALLGSRDPPGPTYVKQLFKDITYETAGPKDCWVAFVDAAYDRGLTPVVRLQGNFEGTGWTKPQADADGSYRTIAQAYARVVAGLANAPKRQGRPLYIEVWNEPNLHLEWSGAANPAEYGAFLRDVSAAIRALGDGGIRILNGGLSQGVRDDPGLGLSVESFIDGLAGVPGALDAFDVWAVHPYPGNGPPQFNLHDGTAGDWPALAIDAYLLELDRLTAHGRSGLQVLLTETGYALGAHNLEFLGVPRIDEANRADYMVRAFRDYWSRWPEVLGVCPYELVDPAGAWQQWDWLYPDGGAHAQYDAVSALDKGSLLSARGQTVVQFQVVANAPAGGYTGRAEVSAPAGSAVRTEAAPVEVQGSLPAPTPTPVVASCYPVLQNGGFESNSCWALAETTSMASYSARRVHSGNRSLLVGQLDGEARRSYSSAQQTFQVPETAQSIRVRYAYFPVSADAAAGRQYVLLQSGQYTEYLKTVAEDRAQWVTAMHEITVTSELTGAVTLYLGAYVPGGDAGVTAMFVDDVQVEVCLPAGAPPPQLAPCPPLATPNRRLPLILHGYRGPAGGVAAAGALASAAAAVTPTPEADALPPWGPALGPEAASAPAVPAPATPVPAALPGLEAMGILPADLPGRLLWDAADGRLLAADGTTLRATSAGTVLYEADLAAQAGALAVDSASGWAWITEPDAGAVEAFAGDGRAVVRVVGLGRPTGIVVAEGRIYVTDSIGRRVAALDATSGEVLQWADLGATPWPIARDAASGRLFVGLVGGGAIAVLDEGTLAPLGEVPLGGTGFPEELVVDAQAGRLYVVHALSARYGAVTAIDTRSLSVVATVTGNDETPLFGAEHLIVPPGGDLLLATAGGLAVLDRDSLALRGLVAQQEGVAAWALDPGTGTLFALAEGGPVTEWNADDLRAQAVGRGSEP